MIDDHVMETHVARFEAFDMDRKVNRNDGVVEFGIWIQEHRDDQPAIRPLAVTPAPSTSRPVLVTPEGYRIEGPGVAEITEMLRSLG